MIKSTKANAIFLATVLVAGIIALSYPSFLVGAQAERENVMDPRYNSYEPDHESDYGMDSYGPDYESDYGMDSYGDEKKSYDGQDNYKSTTEYPSYGKDSNSYDKSKDSSIVSVKKIKCNNINVNINGFNGLEIGSVPQALNSLAAEAQESDEGEVGANSLESGSGSDGSRSSGHDGDSRLVCINNNEFNVGGENGGTPVEDACDECFANLEADLSAGVFTQLEQLIAAGVVIGDFDFEGGTIEQFCEALTLFVEENGAVTVTVPQILAVITNLTGLQTGDLDAILDFLLCLVSGDLLDIDVGLLRAGIANLQ